VVGGDATSRRLLIAARGKRTAKRKERERQRETERP
jgi:hypothetical protein